MEISAAVLSASGEASAPYAASAPLEVRTLTLDPPRVGELLVRIDAAGICHSDLSVINGDRPRPMPMALGHEAAATVLPPVTQTIRNSRSATRWCSVSFPRAVNASPALAVRGIFAPTPRRPMARAD